jgi:hypothetical protein
MKKKEMEVGISRMKKNIEELLANSTTLRSHLAYLKVMRSFNILFDDTIIEDKGRIKEVMELEYMTLLKEFILSNMNTISNELIKCEKNGLVLSVYMIRNVPELRQTQGNVRYPHEIVLDPKQIKTKKELKEFMEFNY